MSADAVLQPGAGPNIFAELQRVFHDGIASPAAIAEGAVKKCLCGHEDDPDWIKDNFSALVERVQATTDEDHQQAQQQAGRLAFSHVLLPLAGEEATAADFVRLLGDNFHELDRFFVGLTQSRRPHGKAFELLISRFINQHYSFAAQALIPNQPDWIFPSVQHFRNHPSDAMILTIKRTVRERWRQMLTEATQSTGMFVATADEEIPQSDLLEMLLSRVYIVVAADMKHDRHYATAPNVITFERFFRECLDPAVERWRSAGVLKATEPKRPTRDPFADFIRPESNSSGFAATKANLRHTREQPSLFD
jgi:hypothetical protein